MCFVMIYNFDVLVVGTGSAGQSAAFACAQAGLKVAIVDKRPFGGTCALRGCDPKKVLVGAEEIVHRWEALRDTLALEGSLSINWPALMRFKRTFPARVPPEREASFKEAGIAAFHGIARFTDPRTIAINGDTFRAGKIVIAVGARPATLGIPGEEYVKTSEEFLELPELPASIVFIGGGYISFEFAHVSARSGAEVAILHRGERPLEGFDADLVARLVEASRAAGIDVHLQTHVKSVERRGDLFTVNTNGESYSGDLVVHGAGRVPEIDDLDLETGGVAYSRRGVTVNEFLQSTSNPRVYSAGDTANSGGLPLTPVAGLTGDIAAENILCGNRWPARLEALPSLVFTNPILASVGKREDEIDPATCTVSVADMSDWYSYRRIRERYAGFKVITHNTEDRVLGAHILGPGAEELINIFALAMRFRLPVSQLRDTVFAYPTYASDTVYMFEQAAARDQKVSVVSGHLSLQGAAETPAIRNAKP